MKAAAAFFVLVIALAETFVHAGADPTKAQDAFSTDHQLNERRLSTFNRLWSFYYQRRQFAIAPDEKSKLQAQMSKTIYPSAQTNESLQAIETKIRDSAPELQKALEAEIASSKDSAEAKKNLEALQALVGDGKDNKGSLAERRPFTNIQTVRERTFQFPPAR